MAPMVRGVAVTGSEVHEEGFVGGNRMLHANPIDGAIGHVVDQNVVGVSERRQNRLRVLEKRRVPVVCVASEESVKYSKPSPPGHWSKGPSGLSSQSGIRWFLPNHDVFYPLPTRMFPMVPALLGRIES